MCVAWEWAIETQMTRGTTRHSKQSGTRNCKMICTEREAVRRGEGQPASKDSG